MVTQRGMRQAEVEVEKDVERRDFFFFGWTVCGSSKTNSSSRRGGGLMGGRVGDIDIRDLCFSGGEYVMWWKGAEGFNEDQWFNKWAEMATLACETFAFWVDCM